MPQPNKEGKPVQARGKTFVTPHSLTHPPGRQQWPKVASQQCQAQASTQGMCPSAPSPTQRQPAATAPLLPLCLIVTRETGHVSLGPFIRLHVHLLFLIAAPELTSERQHRLCVFSPCHPAKRTGTGHDRSQHQTGITVYVPQIPTRWRPDNEGAPAPRGAAGVFLSRATLLRTPTHA